MNYRKGFLSLLILSILLAGCRSKEQEPITQTGFYLDTIIRITLYDTEDTALLQEGMELCRKYDALFSKTNKGSEIYQINHSHGQPVAVSEETLYLIQKGIEFGEKTNGLFDISIGALSSLWDFTGDSYVVPDEAALAEARKQVDYRQICIHGNTVSVPEGMTLDLGGIAKGYIGDQLKDFYTRKGVTSALLDLGGNILCIGTPPGREQFHIGIKRPFSDGESITDVYIKDQCIVTSGTYERYFEKDGTRYHHILDPSTGYPAATDLYSVSIIADHSMEADALSTICLMLGLEQAQEFLESYPGIQAVFITDEYKIIH